MVKSAWKIIPMIFDDHDITLNWTMMVGLFYAYNKTSKWTHLKFLESRSGLSPSKIDRKIRIFKLFWILSVLWFCLVTWVDSYFFNFHRCIAGICRKLKKIDLGNQGFWIILVVYRITKPFLSKVVFIPKPSRDD